MLLRLALLPSSNKYLCQKRECIDYIWPVRDTLEILTGKWKVPILVALLEEGRKFNELERRLEGITLRPLSKELKLVQRIVHIGPFAQLHRVGVRTVCVLARRRLVPGSLALACH